MTSAANRAEAPDQDFAQLDRFLADTMAGILDKLNAALNPSRRLAHLRNRTEQEV
jgi:hypothetical protein